MCAEGIAPSAGKIDSCQWPGLEDPLYSRYHDTEWGVPKARDKELFEKLVLEGFQAGLSWLTILRKRDNFRRAFDGFDARAISEYGDHEIARLMNDTGIVRNRMKITATVENARAYIALCENTTLAKFLWSFLDDGPICNRWAQHEDIPAQTPLSQRISKALKGEGFKFVGPTTTYAFMQSVGIVNDHLVGCPRHRDCEKLQRDYSVTNTS